MGAIPHYMGIAIDDKKITEDLIVEALQKYDVLLLTGGVSMGDFDFIPEIIKKVGVETKFEKIAIKPGRPTVFGTYKDKYVFGLPGNPVSSFSIFEIFVKPVLFKCMGYNYQPISLEVILAEDFTRRSNKRTEFFPVVLNNDGSVSPVSYHGSAHIHALCGAIGSMQINVGINKILKGEKVHVRLF
jgi:molybdopterin molybdotransferase